MCMQVSTGPVPVGPRLKAGSAVWFVAVNHGFHRHRVGGERGRLNIYRFQLPVIGSTDAGSAGTTPARRIHPCSPERGTFRFLSAQRCETMWEPSVSLVTWIAGFTWELNRQAHESAALFQLQSISSVTSPFHQIQS